MVSPRAQAATAHVLARWATELAPSPDDLALAERSLNDTVAVATAAKNHPLAHLFAQLDTAGRLAATAHVLDFDDLHMPSTAHISAVCVAAALATDGGARAYLAGAGVMARLGTALGWRHYSAGWHATCTAGAPAAAVTAAAARGLDAEQTATAIALAIPAAGGTQRAFGTAAKSLQVGFAADAGIRAANLAAAGATADPTALDQWMTLVNAERPMETTRRRRSGRARDQALPVLLRPPAPDRSAEGSVGACRATSNTIRVTTPRSSLQPLIHSRPTTGLEGKFSLEYAIAAFLTDRRADFHTFTDEAVQRPGDTTPDRADTVDAHRRGRRPPRRRDHHRDRRRRSPRPSTFPRARPVARPPTRN